MNKILARIFLVLTIGCTVFIFANSLMPSEVSDRMSNFLAERGAYFLRLISSEDEAAPASALIPDPAPPTAPADTTASADTSVSADASALDTPAAPPTAPADTPAPEDSEPWITGQIKKIADRYFSLFDTSTKGEANATVRKMAHFSEFLVLSVFFSLFCMTGIRQKFRYCIIYVLFFTLLTAVTDEFLQTFADSRGPRVADALIDLSGAVIGLGAVCTVRLLYRGILYMHRRLVGGNK